MTFCYLDIFTSPCVSFVTLQFYNQHSYRHQFPVDGSVHGDEHDEGKDGVEEEVEPHHVHLHHQLHTVPRPPPRLTVM